MKQRMKSSSFSKLQMGENIVDSDGDSSSNLKIETKMHGKFEKKLVKFDALPDYMKDNEFIRDYYRCEWPLKDVTFSVFSIHNETLNIWTHLLGFLTFLGLMAMSLTEKATVENFMATFFRKATESPLMTTVTNKTNGSDAFFLRAKILELDALRLNSLSYPIWWSLSAYALDSYLRHIPKPSILHVTGDSDAIVKWPWFVFLGGAMCCLLCSSLSHLFACHSKRFNIFFWRLDYAGISLMIVCSFFAPIYYAFSCHPFSCMFYLTSITLVGILAIITLLAPALSSPRFRSFRATLFLAMGFSGVIPAAHAVILYYDTTQILVALGYEIAMGLLYAAGAVFYVSRIPERWKPGKFDILGHSHQIFHVFVVAAALAHSAATLVIMDWRQGLPSCDAMHGILS